MKSSTNSLVYHYPYFNVSLNRNKINDLSNMLMDEGIPMSYHEHMGTIIQSEEDLPSRSSFF